jgi:predicted solute-binding protein
MSQIHRPYGASNRTSSLGSSLNGAGAAGGDNQADGTGGHGPGATSVRPLAVGWITYLNLVPFRHELLRQAGGEVELHKGSPAQVNKMLTDGKVALAPCSSVCLLRNANHDIALPLGVASNGAVSSVYIGLQREHAELYERIRIRQAEVRDLFRQGTARQGQDARKIAAYVWATSAVQVKEGELPPALHVTPASATSTALARVLYRLWFGETAYNMMASEGSVGSTMTGLSTRKPLELLIGDEALAKKAGFWQIIDLGEAWRELTDLPFVFAVWQTAKKPLSQAWRQRLLEAGEMAQARMKIEPCVYFPDLPVTDVQGHAIDLAAYWKHIHYRLGPAHFRGLALYLSLVRSMSATFDDAVVGKIMRWEAMGDAVGPN